MTRSEPGQRNAGTALAQTRAADPDGDRSPSA